MCVVLVENPQSQNSSQIFKVGVGDKMFVAKMCFFSFVSRDFETHIGHRGWHDKIVEARDFF